jgi:hypothetical protein
MSRERENQLDALQKILGNVSENIPLVSGLCATALAATVASCGYVPPPRDINNRLP